MRTPTWAVKPFLRKRTVILTASGWTVKETGETLVKQKKLAAQLTAYFGLSNLTFSGDKVHFTYGGAAYHLTAAQIEPFFKTPTGFAVSSVTVAPTTATLAVNATRQLVPTVLPAGAVDKTVSYSTSDATKATVDANGLITAKATGTATITVTTSQGARTATCVVTIS